MFRGNSAILLQKGEHIFMHSSSNIQLWLEPKKDTLNHKISDYSHQKHSLHELT